MVVGSRKIPAGKVIIIISLLLPYMHKNDESDALPLMLPELRHWTRILMRFETDAVKI